MILSPTKLGVSKSLRKLRRGSGGAEGCNCGRREFFGDRFEGSSNGSNARVHDLSRFPFESVRDTQLYGHDFSACPQATSTVLVAWGSLDEVELTLDLTVPKGQARCLSQTLGQLYTTMMRMSFELRKSEPNYSNFFFIFYFYFGGQENCSLLVALTLWAGFRPITRSD